MRIGIVSEGVNDFIALRATIIEVANVRSREITSIDSLQPLVDATSEKQVGTGGWARVKVWLEDNAGDDLNKILAPRLFSSSPVYDVLIVHLDGDVVWLCNEFSAVERAKCFQSTADVVSTVEAYIERKLQVPDALDDKIVYAVPVMHTESWLMCAAKRRTLRKSIEHRRTVKKPVLRYLSFRYKKDIKGACLEAATALGHNLGVFREELESLDHFYRKLDSVMQ